MRIVRRICRLQLFGGPLFPQACLRQALVLYYILSRLGYPVAIHFGVYKVGETLRGHSWVMIHGVPLAERIPPEALQAIYSFPAAGSRASLASAPFHPPSHPSPAGADCLHWRQCVSRENSGAGGRS